MPLQFEKIQGNVVFIRTSGTLTDDDYASTFVPTMEDLFKSWGNLRMLFIMEPDFRGWDLHGAWDELKFELKHHNDVIKVGVVGDQRWEKWATRLSRLFTRANSRFFALDELEDAKAWITAGGD